MKSFVSIAAAIAAASALVWTAGHAQAQALTIVKAGDRIHVTAPVYHRGPALNAVPASCERTRARIVTRAAPISPPFVVSTPISSRGSLNDCRTPGPGYYGLPDYADATIYVRIRNAPGWNIGLRAVGIDPFQQIPDHLPKRYQRAQEWWLHAEGFVQRARILKRVHVPAAPPTPAELNERQDAAEHAEEMSAVRSGEPYVKVKHKPTPRATIRLTPPARSGGDQPA
jgi:hypothetical protein